MQIIIESVNFFLCTLKKMSTFATPFFNHPLIFPLFSPIAPSFPEAQKSALTTPHNAILPTLNLAAVNSLKCFLVVVSIPRLRGKPRLIPEDSEKPGPLLNSTVLSGLSGGLPRVPCCLGHAQTEFAM